MAGIKELQQRITSVGNIKQITRAMEMVAFMASMGWSCLVLNGGEIDVGHYRGSGKDKKWIPRPKREMQVSLILWI